MKLFIRKNALWFIIAVYFIISSAGIFFNYSLYNTTGDEGPLISAVLKMIADRDIRPAYPSFYHLGLGAYLYLPIFVIFLGFLRLSGLFSSIEALKQFGQVEFAKLLPLARFISVLTGIASIVLVYKITKKLFNNEVVPLLAAILLSTSLIFVQTSHFARIWMPQVLTVLLALYFIIELYEKEKIGIKNYLWCGLTIGLAFGTHVVGVFIYFSFLAVHYFKNEEKKLKDIIFNKLFWLANFSFAIVYFLVYYLNPDGFTRYLGGVIPNPGKMLSISDSFLPYIDRVMPVAEGGTNTFGRMIIYYLTALWQYEPLILILTIFGSVLLFIKKRRIAIIFYAFILAYFLAVCSISIKVPRYLLPILPIFAVISAYGLGWFYERAKNKKLAGALIAVVCLASIYPSLLWDYKFLLPSSRLEAAHWIYNNFPPGANIINFDSNFELNENRQTLADMVKYTAFATRKRVFLLNSSDEIIPKPNYYILSYRHYENIPNQISEKKYDYIVLSWFNEKERLYWLSKLDKVNLSNSELTLIKRFPAEAKDNDVGFDLGGDIDRPLVNLYKLKQNGPIVDIYKIKYN